MPDDFLTEDRRFHLAHVTITMTIARDHFANLAAAARQRGDESVAAKLDAIVEIHTGALQTIADIITFHGGTP